MGKTIWKTTLGQLCDAAVGANLSRPRPRRNSIVANSASFLPLRKNMCCFKKLFMGSLNLFCLSPNLRITSSVVHFLLPWKWRHCLGQWSRQGNEQSRELSSDEISRTTFDRRQLWTLATRVDLIHLERPGSKARGAFLAFLQWSWKRYIMIWFNTYDFAVITLLICP